MNIQDAKDEIKRTLLIYTQKDAGGGYRIPVEKQRPILLIGPPGIGKTAIMKQIAEETGMGLVSYTMTHHTRQSAIGLPYITERVFGGKSYSITEYTMSEIVSSLYIYMEETGHTNGILFLDEINCVSETLSPVMLQLLQNKTFGNHPLPEGWLIVAAGNPPEYNKSVREMDMVTLDRVKNMDIDADLTIWQKYAIGNHVHPAVRAYLHNYPSHFYRIESDTRGKHFVTARGWEDLSVALTAYEENQLKATETLFLQYIQHEEIAHSFALFYEYFSDAYRQDWSDENLMAKTDLKHASPAEVLALTTVLFHQIRSRADLWVQDREFLREVEEALRTHGEEPLTEAYFEKKRQAMKIKRDNNLLSSEEEFHQEDVLRELEEVQRKEYHMPTEQIPGIRREFLQAKAQQLQDTGDSISTSVSRAYQMLRQSSIAEAASLYLTNDLSSDRSCCQLLLHAPAAEYLEESSQLLQELQD